MNLSPLVNLREVGDYFLGLCTSMKSIDLTPLQAVEVLPSGFLYGCSIEKVDLSPLVNLRKVGANFLSACTGIKNIDLSPLSALDVLPDGFLSGCSCLVAVDLSPLVNLGEVGGGGACLQHCPSLKAIRLASHQSANLLPSNVREFITT